MSKLFEVLTFYLKYTTNRVFEYTHSPFQEPKRHVFGQFVSCQLDYLTIFWYIIMSPSSFQLIEHKTILKHFKVNEVKRIRQLRTNRKWAFLIRIKHRSLRSGKITTRIWAEVLGTFIFRLKSETLLCLWGWPCRKVEKLPFGFPFYYHWLWENVSRWNQLRLFFQKVEVKI